MGGGTERGMEGGMEGWRGKLRREGGIGGTKDGAMKKERKIGRTEVFRKEGGRDGGGKEEQMEGGRKRDGEMMVEMRDGEQWK